MSRQEETIPAAFLPRKGSTIRFERREATRLSDRSRKAHVEREIFCLSSFCGILTPKREIGAGDVGSKCRASIEQTH